nr:hypothetical protein [Tanacetum cinerariifolium]
MHGSRFIELVAHCDDLDLSNFNGKPGNKIKYVLQFEVYILHLGDVNGTHLLPQFDKNMFIPPVQVNSLPLWL